MGPLTFDILPPDVAGPDSAPAPKGLPDPVVVETEPEAAPPDEFNLPALLAVCAVIAGAVVLFAPRSRKDA